MSIKRLNIARRKVDQLDKKIFNLIKRRTKIVKYMLRLKKFKKQIVDRNRIKKVLKNIKKNSIKKKVDPKLTVKIWNSMIKSYIEFEKRNFNRK